MDQTDNDRRHIRCWVCGQQAWSEYGEIYCRTCELNEREARLLEQEEEEQ